MLPLFCEWSIFTDSFALPLFIVILPAMPYANLLEQRSQRYETLDDMDKYDCTIEEREEYFGHIRDGTLLFAGVDYPMILREAEQSADIILWDGGNNDTPFYKPDLHITLVDSLRPTDQEHYYPGEINVRMSDLILLSKVDPETGMEKAAEHAKHLQPLLRPFTPVLFGGSTIKPEATNKSGELYLLDGIFVATMCFFYCSHLPFILFYRRTNDGRAGCGFGQGQEGLGH